MLINASLSSNDSLLFPPNPHTDFECFLSRSYTITFSLSNITSISLLLPLCIFILHHGLQQWRQTRSTSSPAMSHSDSFIYHLVTMEITGVFGCSLNLCALFMNQGFMLKTGFYLFSFASLGELFFHILTCLERYLAVVHPITYLSLRTERGIRIRNICIVCVWLLSFIVVNVLSDYEYHTLVIEFFLLISSLTAVSFCSVSVLCVLIRPGPGGQGGVRERADQSKQRAFYTILVILGVLVLRFAWDLTLFSLYFSEGNFSCVLVVWSFLTYLPSSLVLPLLFLLRKKKLKGQCICRSN